MIVRSIQGDTVDLICHRHLGTTAGGIVEETLSINPGLALLGVILPIGTVITLPDSKTAIKKVSSHVTSLWE